MRCRVARSANDTQDAVFGQRAGCERMAPLVSKPGVGPRTVDMGPVDESNENVDVEQKRHCVSSSSCLISSGVTIAPGLTGSCKMPFR